MRKYDKRLKTSLFILLILGIAIGYAYLTSNLDIAGSTKISGNSWDIHFNNVQISQGSVEAITPATIDSSDNTKVNYSIELELPGDYYEFTVDIVNAGTIPGKINLVSNSGIDSQYQDLIGYEIKYTNGNNVAVNDIINAGSTKHIRVKVYYKEDVDKDDLPSTNIDLDLEFEIEYIQSNESETTAGNLLQNLSTTNSCITKYEGQVTDRVGVTETATNVYFDKCADKRNVIFGGFCWQMIRTTETGGIKMIYNGEPVNGKCESNRGNHKGIVQSSDGTIQSIGSSYLYGSSFTYDTTTNEFTLVDIETATWSDLTYENLIGKFTCKNTSGTCSTIYQINGYSSNKSARLSFYTIANTNYAQIGTSSYNADNGSPAKAGYMFNRQYNYSSKVSNIDYMLNFRPLSTNYWYADSVEWGSSIANKYNLVDAYQVTSSNDYSSLVGKYTFANATETYTNAYVYYIVAVKGTTMYYISLANGNNLSYYNYTITYGDTYTDNGNGTYTINNPTTFNRSDWVDNYQDVKYKYFCTNATNNTCSNISYAMITSIYSLAYTIYNSNKNYKYGSGFTYDEGTNTYTLNNDSVSFWEMGNPANQTSLNTHHYTCWNSNGICSVISYVYYIDAGETYKLYYINLTGGKDVSVVLNEMLYDDDVNRYNSSIKGIVDAWYAQNLSTKTDMLEDTVYCNARYANDNGSWNPSGGDVTSGLRFKNYNATSSLVCNSIIDQFAVSNNKAKLNFPVSLLQNEEVHNINNRSLMGTGSEWWTLSPNSFLGDSSSVLLLNTSGFSTYIGSITIYAYGVRPVVSLASNVVISSGSGSKTDPWIVE